jgi:hypothetical protein
MRRVRGKGRELTGLEGELLLPPGYRLDRSDPDVWVLRRPEGWMVAHFSAQGATREAIEQTAWEDYEGDREEEYP